jgi:hypothetical protein
VRFRGTAAFLTVTLAAIAPAVAQGQPPSRLRTVVQADSAFAAGNLGLADSLYYIAVRYWPRDPGARAALGRYLAAQGKTKPGIVLLEEARLFGGDPGAIGAQLAPLYEHLGEWRALLTLPGSPLSIAERRRAAWLSERPFRSLGHGGGASIVETAVGDTIARVAVRIGAKSVIASIVGSDVGFVVGSRLADSGAIRFEGDPTVIAFDSMTVGQAKFANVPATIGRAGSTMTIGVASLGRVVVMIDYARKRLALTRSDPLPADATYPLTRSNGQLRVLDRGRWIPLGELASSVARASRTLVIDVAAGQARVRP